ncbi:MAG TPA: hypothetical protein VLL05_03400 [Terriglobales bacterium]|nr:hypothetical protein [Terriglobales bacterium]
MWLVKIPFQQNPYRGDRAEDFAVSPDSTIEIGVLPQQIVDDGAEIHQRPNTKEHSEQPSQTFAKINQVLVFFWLSPKCEDSIRLWGVVRQEPAHCGETCRKQQQDKGGRISGAGLPPLTVPTAYFG